MRYAKWIITFFLPVVALVTMSSCAHEHAAPMGSARVPVAPVGEPVASVGAAAVGEPAVAVGEPAAALTEPETEALGDAKILRVAHEANSAERAGRGRCGTRP